MLFCLPPLKARFSIIRPLGSLPAGLPVEEIATLSDAISHIDAKYAFMFPVSILVATAAISSGIGGAALYGPIFLIAFPVLGPQYPLASPAAAVGIAILVETFGFGSGVVAYTRKGLIDFNTALKYAFFSVPAALFSSEFVALPAIVLKVVYSLLMLSLSAFLLLKMTSNEPVPQGTHHETSFMSRGDDDIRGQYQLEVQDVALAVFGGVLCGLLGVGIGELVLPQLIRKGFSLSVAAATSTLVVALTCFGCAGVQISSLIEAGGISAVPVNLVMYMIPGVVIGAQVAAALQGSVSKNVLLRAIGVLFGLIGVLFAVLTVGQIGK